MSYYINGILINHEIQIIHWKNMSALNKFNYYIENINYCVIHTNLYVWMEVGHL